MNSFSTHKYLFKIVKVYNSIEDFSPKFKVILTLGTFDGVHIGHQSIISQLNEVSKSIGGESVLLTFYPHPRHVLFPEDNNLFLITSIEERKDLLKQHGLDHLIIHPFSLEFSRMNSVHFVRDILVQKLNINTLVIGYDHHFGRNRKGNFDELISLSKIYDFNLMKIKPKTLDKVKVSSSKIRKLILSGNIKNANNYLGSRFTLKGLVVLGNQLGSDIGYPTANIQLDSDFKIIPPFGVYVVTVMYEDINYVGILNIGNNPTISHLNDPTIEVHILDFSKNLYDEKIRIFFVEKIRNLEKFDSINLLAKAINEDEKLVRDQYSYLFN